jgi:hypothetical protein
LRYLPPALYRAFLRITIVNFSAARIVRGASTTSHDPIKKSSAETFMSTGFRLRVHRLRVGAILPTEGEKFEFVWGEPSARSIPPSVV